MHRAILFLLVMAAPASAHDWQAARAEGAADLCYARYLFQLDCAALPAAAESQRQVVNAQIYAAYQRWQPVSPAPQPITSRPRPSLGRR